MRTLGLASVAVAVSVCYCHAQTALQDIEARTDRDRASESAPLDLPRVQFTSQRPPSNADEIRFTLQDVVVGGGEAFSADEVRALFADDLGADVTLTAVFDIAGRIQALYREADYIFTRVVVPAQEIEGGVVRLDIIEAVIETVDIEEPDGPVGPVRDLAERMVAPLIGVRNPTGAMLERALLNINELPGVTRATAVPQAGEDGARGGLALFVNIERDPFEAVVYADNRQTPGIGRGVIGGTVTFNSFTSAADTTSVSIFNSFGYRGDVVIETGEVDGPGDFDERNTILVAHQRAIGVDGLTLRGTALYSRTSPGDNLAALDISGEQKLATLELSYPLFRTRQFELSAAVSTEYLNSETDLSGGAFQLSNDKLRIGAIALDGLYRDPIGYTNFTASARFGFDLLGASPRGDPQLSRFDGQSEFGLVRGEIERLLVFNEDLSALVRVGGQYSFDSLLAAEEFAIGGITYGRGFDPSEFTGDHGVGVAAEMRYLTAVALDEFSFSFESYGFFDYGQVWNRGDGEPSSASLFSIGGGLRFFLPEDIFVGAEVALPLNRPLERIGRDGEKIEGPRFFLNLSKRF